MGLFSIFKSIGSLLPGVGSVIKGVEAVGSLLGAKSGTTAHTATKVQTLGSGLLTKPPPTFSFHTPFGVPLKIPRAILSSSPVMPGGGIATPQGIMAPGGGVPPLTFGKSSRGLGGKKRRRRKGKRTTTRARRRSTGRKLKFGSPAWRKKYMKTRRRKSR